jgi:pimeloyl-ACP methyl ester carboxylesterase
VPVLILAGGADRKAEPAEARALAERLAGHARLVVIEGGEHGRLEEADPAAYRAAVTAFLSACGRAE